MLGNDYFYRSTIRNYVIAFGSMFNDVDIKRTNAAGTVSFSYTHLTLPTNREV